MKIFNRINGYDVEQLTGTKADHRALTGVLRLIFAALFVALLASEPSVAQVARPINDNIEDAIHLRNNLTYFVGNNDRATMEVGEPDFENGQPAGSSVWFKYRADSDGFLVLISESYEAPSYLIEVFDGRSFDPVDRLASGSAESIWSFKIIRILVPVVEDQIVYIRVANIGPRSLLFGFSMHVRHTSSDGDLLVIPLREPKDVLIAPGIYGEVGYSDILRPFRSVYMYINTMLQSGNITPASFNFPTGWVMRSSGRIFGRSSKKPGVQFAGLRFEHSLHSSVGGTWNYRFVTKIKFGSISRRFEFPFPVMVSRRREASITYTISTATIDTVLGDTARLLIAVNNNSSFGATGCRLLTFSPIFGRPSYPFEARWRQQHPVGAMNAAFDIPAGSTRTLEVFINTNFVGQYNNVTPNLACENARQTRYTLSPRFNITSRS